MFSFVIVTHETRDGKVSSGFAIKGPDREGVKLLEFLTPPSIAQGKLSRESQGD